MMADSFALRRHRRMRNPRAGSRHSSTRSPVRIGIATTPASGSTPMSAAVGTPRMSGRTSLPTTSLTVESFHADTSVRPSGSTSIPS